MQITARGLAGPEGLVVRITVRDWGQGIPPDIRDRIFEPFFTTRRSRGGTGLGLHLAYAAAQGSLRGSLECAQVDVGTAFICEFPSLNSTKTSDSLTE